MLPSSIKKMTLRNFAVRGKQFDIVVEKERIQLLEK